MHEWKFKKKWQIGTYAPETTEWIYYVEAFSVNEI